MPAKLFCLLAGDPVLVAFEFTVRSGLVGEHIIQMSVTPEDERHGGEILAQEIREEAGRLMHHPVDELKRLEQVVEEGESAATPLLAFLGVAIILVVIVALVITVVFVAYYRG